MPNYRSEFLKNGHYHVYNRGLNKQILFHSQADFLRFHKYVLKSSDACPMVEILAYSYLDNHFHFVLRSKDDSHQISDFMRRIQGSYASYCKIVYKNTNNPIGRK